MFGVGVCFGFGGFALIVFFLYFPLSIMFCVVFGLGGGGIVMKKKEANEKSRRLKICSSGKQLCRCIASAKEKD